MQEGRKDTAFGRWLRETIEAQGKSVRGVARDIAEGAQGGATERNIETARRALNKYLREGKLPSRPMRRSIAGALGVSEEDMPSVGDEPLTREAIVAHAREGMRLLRQLERWAASEGVLL